MKITCLNNNCKKHNLKSKCGCSLYLKYILECLDNNYKYFIPK
jgi:hypothetical protein